MPDRKNGGWSVGETGLRHQRTPAPVSAVERRLRRAAAENAVAQTRLQRISRCDIDTGYRPWGEPGRGVVGDAEATWNRWPQSKLVTEEKPGDLEVCSD